MKKALKISGIILLLLIITLVVAPFLFQNQIKDMVKTFVNDNVNAEVTFDDINLSFVKSFPQAYVSIDNLKIVNRAPFEEETMATAQTIAFDLSVKELFKKTDEEPIVINSVEIDEALVTLKLNYKGTANYDIALKKEDQAKTTTSDSGFSFDIDNYAINNSALSYIDESSKMAIYTSNLNHSGKASFSDNVSQLDSHTDTKVTMLIDSIAYLKNNSVKLDALIDMDLENNTYTFKDNKGYINNLPLEFNGFVQLAEEGQNVDITFKNPSSSFKDFLAVIPKQYSKNLDNVETTGDFKVNGKIEGLVTENTIPKLDINIRSNNASFKYPDLPKRVENITIDASVKNTNGNTDDTFINLNTLNFKIDDDTFKSSATIKNLTKNMLVNADIDGTLNLANVSKAYPIELDNELSGILKGQLTTAFDMNAIETNAYERIKNNGTISVTDFVFSSEDIVNPINITKTNIAFTPKQVTLENFDATTGKSDLKATGTIDNLLGFLLSDKDLKGNFKVDANTFAVNDFMVADDTTSKDNKTTDASESLKIPSFLDCTINANAKTVLYDNLTLKDVKGQLVIKDQKADLKNMTSSIFDGNLAIAGTVSTKEKTPVFNMNLGVSNFDIAKSTAALDLLQTLAPIANSLQGKLNTTINLKGDLNESFTPKISSISGNALAEILTSQIQSNSELLDGLSTKLDFIDFKKLDLKDLKTKLDFSDGNVTIKPFTIKYQDIPIEVSGSHSFTNILNYKATLQVPAKYLGSDVTSLIAKIDDAAVEKLTIPVTANISGNYKSPKIETDLTSGVANLTNQLIEIQKQKLIDQGKEELTDILGGLLGGNKDDETNDKETDSSSSNNPDPKDEVTETVTNILGGILGGKNKKKEQKKDSIKN